MGQWSRKRPVATGYINVCQTGKKLIKNCNVKKLNSVWIWQWTKIIPIKNQMGWLLAAIAIRSNLNIASSYFQKITRKSAFASPSIMELNVISDVVNCTVATCRLYLQLIYYNIHPHSLTATELDIVFCRVVLMWL